MAAAIRLLHGGSFGEARSRRGRWRSPAFALRSDWAVMLAVLYLGAALFCVSDYAAYRLSDQRWFLPPRAALVATYGFAGLAITMVVAALSK